MIYWIDITRMTLKQECACERAVKKSLVLQYSPASHIQGNKNECME